MKAIRWILGFLSVFVFIFVLDLIFYNYVFNSLLLSQGGLVRAPEELRKLLPIMFGGQLLFALLFTYYFFKMYKNATWIVLRGFFFGFWMGLFLFGWRLIWEYYLFAISKKLLGFMLLLGWLECIFSGLALGIIGWLIPKLFESMKAKPAPQATAPQTAAPPVQAPAPQAPPQPPAS